MDCNIFDRKNTLKTWKPIQTIPFTQDETIQYEQKIQNNCEKYGLTYRNIISFINLECENRDVRHPNHNYIKYLVLKHLNNLVKYIENKGIYLENVKLGIKTILNEIVTNQVSEDYYTNTLEIYREITNKNYDDIDAYDLIDQAIRLDNKKVLYYIIFSEDEDLNDRLYEIMEH